MPGLRSFGHIGAVTRAADALPSANRRLTAVDPLSSRRYQPQQQQHQGAFDKPSSIGRQTQTRQPLESQPAAIANSQRSIADSRYSHASSGSDHEPNSEYLAALVSDFMDVDEKKGRSSQQAREEDEEEANLEADEIAAAIRGLAACPTPLEAALRGDVSAAIDMECAESAAFPQEETTSSGNLRRAVMTRLRAAGYNAAACKSRWDHSKGFPGGDYEYIDVIVTSENSPIPRERVIVDLDFRSQFQVARPTPEFEAALNAAPAVFVGRVERLQQLIDILADACRKSLRVQGMHLPPWRKLEYLRAKWLSPYKRTTNAQAAPQPSGLSVAAPMPVFAGAFFVAKPAHQQQDQQCVFPIGPPAPAPRAAAPVKACGAPRGSLGLLLQRQGALGPVV